MANNNNMDTAQQALEMAQTVAPGLLGTIVKWGLIIGGAALAFINKDAIIGWFKEITGGEEETTPEAGIETVSHEQSQETGQPEEQEALCPTNTPDCTPDQQSVSR